MANVTDVANRLGRPITDQAEIAQVNAWLSDIDVIIRSRISDLDSRLSEGLITAEVLTFVTANAVVRKIKNPDGKQNERIDDYSYGLTENAARGDLFLTDDEWAMLLNDASDGAFSIMPGWYV